MTLQELFINGIWIRPFRNNRHWSSAGLVSQETDEPESYLIGLPQLDFQL
jgi:hypothetical protein